MRSSRAAARYAGALFQSAREANAPDAVYEDLRRTATLMERSSRLADLLTSPILPAEAKKRALREAVGPRGHPLAQRFLALLVDKKRIGLLPLVADTYHEMWNDYRGLVEVEVTSAVALEAGEEERLTRVLERRTGRTVALHKRVERGLLGGVSVRYNDTVIEGSVRSQLRALHRHLLRVRIGPAPLTAD